MIIKRQERTTVKDNIRRKRNSYPLLVEMGIGTATKKIVCRLLKNLKTELSYTLAIPLLERLSA